MDYQTGSHTKFKIEYHFVWATKYRYQVLTGDIKTRVRELIRQTCEGLEVKILKGVVSVDHVHILGCVDIYRNQSMIEANCTNAKKFLAV